MEHPDASQRGWFHRHKVLTVAGGILILLFLVGIITSGDDVAPTASDEPAAEQPQQPAGDVSAEPGESTDGQAGPQTLDQSSASPSVPPAKHPGIGDPARDGKFEFVVTKIQSGVATVGEDFLQEEAQGQFVLVTMTVRNIGDEAQLFDASNQKAIDSEKREHSADSAASLFINENNASFLTEINPGNSITVTVVFDVPKDAKLMTLDLHDSFLSGGVLISVA